MSDTHIGETPNTAKTGHTTPLSPVSLQRLSQDIRRMTPARWVFTHLNRPVDGLNAERGI